MLPGREKELALLENLYQENGFQFLILYGRRRVGKTRLLQEFARNHPVIFFSAQEKNEATFPLRFARRWDIRRNSVFRIGKRRLHFWTTGRSTGRWF